MAHKPVSDNLDDAEALARELAAYTEDDEPTSPVINVHNHFDSKHDGEITVVEAPVQQIVKGVPWGAIGAGVGALALAALATLSQHCAH